MTEYTQFTAIVPASAVDDYRSAAATLHPAADGMFTTPLYAGAEIAHYISTGLIDTIFADVVTQPAAFAAAAGVTLEEAQGFKDGFFYTAIGDAPEDEESPAPLHGLAAIESLGLSLSPVEVVEDEVVEEEVVE